MKQIYSFVSSFIILGLSASIACAQSNDALLNTLVSKGILTAQEAEALKRETATLTPKTTATALGMQNWVKSIRLGGEFRGRYEGFHFDHADATDRHRFRYRLRLGVVVSLTDDFDVALRLTSGEPSGNLGGDPLSGNSTLQDNGSKKFVYVDLAYARWSPVRSDALSGALTIGKMESPLVVSDLVLDDEYTPEGIGGQFTWKPRDSHTFRFNGGAFVLDELSTSNRDPFLFGAQARWDATWPRNLASTAGLTALSVQNEKSLPNGNVPNGNRGNNRNDSGAPATDFTPIDIDTAITWRATGFPLYPGTFPMKLQVEYMINPAAADQNTAWSVGMQFGQAGKRHQWELAYRWKTIEADAWYEEIMDSDFGAYYAEQTPNTGFSGTGAGFGAGTNVRGHIIKAAYSPTDSMTLLFACYLTKLISESPAGSHSQSGRWQASALWKF